MTRRQRSLFSASAPRTWQWMRSSSAGRPELQCSWSAVYGLRSTASGRHLRSKRPSRDRGPWWGVGLGVGPVIIRPMAHTPVETATPVQSSKGFQPFVPPTQSPAEFTAKAILIGVIFGVIFGASTVYLGLARRVDGVGLDSDRGARDLGAQEAGRLDDPREQHRPDDRVGRRVGRRRRRVHDSGAALSGAARTRLLQLHADPPAVVCRRHPRRADDGAAAPRADRQGARRAALSRRHGLRRSARRRRTRRQAGGARLQRPRHRRAVEVALSNIFESVPRRGRPFVRAHRHSFPTPH